jgi:hypothetical protein
MQNRPTRRSRFPRLPSGALAFAAAVVLSAGCVKQITSEERLERETSPQTDTVTAEELSKVSCVDAPDGLASARNQPTETERLNAYIELFSRLSSRAGQLELGLARNPDLIYRSENKELVGARDQCAQSATEVKQELEGFVRELVDVPTLSDVKGGNTVTVARLDPNTLRQAIEILAPEDKEQLLAKVLLVEKKLKSRPEPVKKRGK